VTLLLFFGYALVALFALCFLAWVHGAFWRAFYHVETSADEVHRVRCEDQWPISMYRYRGTPALARHPVLLCHGLAANAAFMDLMPGASLARYLQGLGFEVWSLELRGCSQGSRPGGFTDRSWDIRLEDFIDLDATAALRHVLEQTGAQQVHWVGHSMGGIVGLGVAQGPEAGLLASITTLASPARIRPASPLRSVAPLGWALGWLPYLPTRFMACWVAPFYFDSPLTGSWFNRKHGSWRVIRRGLSNAVGDIPVSLLRQFARWTADGNIVASDGRDFTDGLAQIEVPLMAIAGDDDLVAPPSSVRLAVERAASERRAWLNLGGEGEGAQITAYGHGDLVIGANALRDVHPRGPGALAARGRAAGGPRAPERPGPGARAPEPAPGRAGARRVTCPGTRTATCPGGRGDPNGPRGAQWIDLRWASRRPGRRCAAARWTPRRCARLWAARAGSHQGRCVAAWWRCRPETTSTPTCPRWRRWPTPRGR
jgi:pimeloyl-ACP methyl ester carboxylesterase